MGLMDCPGCDIGQRGSRVTIEKPKSSASASAGGLIDLDDDANWEAAGPKQWAKIITRGGQENFRFNQVAATVSRILQVGWNSFTATIQPRWRVRFTEGGQNKKWDIAAAFDIDAAHETVEVHCTEVVT